jgi:dephospho-CoA kinase
MAFEYAIALTGGVATGKSSTTTMLMLFGFRFIDADKIAHQLLDDNANKIADMFGQEYVKNNKVDRKPLGLLVFKNADKKKELEEFLHPLIYAKIEAEAIKQDKFKKPYIIDIPLFFETSRYPISKSIVVYATQKQQLKRLMSRDGFDEQEALRRINSQMPIDEKQKKATYVINNSKTLKNLQDECERVKELIIKIS